MIVAVKAHEWQKEEWMQKPSNEHVEIVWVSDFLLTKDKEVTDHQNADLQNADAYFDLTFEEYGAAFENITTKPLFINAVVNTLNQLPSNVCRINAWKTFLQRDTVEVATNNNGAKNILDKIGWKYIEVPDVPGMIAARTIAMIINEAYFALGDEVSSKADIDTAMKLGTNYPYGPFEWSEKIGLHNIYRLLKELSKEDQRYLPAPALEQQLKAIA